MSSAAVKKTVKPVIVKSFRLFDFHIYDDEPKDGSGSDSGSDQEDPSKRRTFVDNNIFVIQMFGVNERGETCCIYVQDFEPFFYLKVGDNWTNNHKNELIREIQSKLDKRFSGSIVSSELVDHHKLYGFAGGKKHKFVKINFKNTIAMNKTKGLWYTYVSDPKLGPVEGKPAFGTGIRKRVQFIFKGVSIDPYEGNIPPLLRYLHINNISPSGWVSFRTNRVINSAIKTTTCKYEYIIPLKELVPMPDKETMVPYKICSFDIEASSSHGDFPLPIKSYKRLAFNLVDAFIKQSQFMDTAKGKILLQQVILSAFGYAKFDDVDLVYPKRPQSKERIKSLIHILLTESFERARTANGEEDNSYMLTIDSMFEQMRDLMKQGGDGDVSNINTGAGAGAGADSVVPQFYGKYAKKAPKLDKTTTIVDALMSNSYDRDVKVQLTNDVLTRLFPQLEGDQVTFIGSTFVKYGEPEPYLNHCVVLGSCDPVDGAVIETCETETDLLLKWRDIMQTENPDIIIGYNIFGFDYEFMFRRAQENNCAHEFLLLSRKMGELCATTERDNPSELLLETTKLKVASGEYDMRYVKMTGRLQIDMYTYFRKDFNFSSYKLDDVAAQFISDDVNKIVCTTHPRFGEVTELYSKNLAGLHVGDFIHIDLTGFTADYYKKGQKFKVLDIQCGREVVEMLYGKEMTNIYNVIVIQGHENIDTKDKTIKWGMAKDDVTPQDIFRLSKGSASDRAIVAKYCIQDCNLVHHLMNKIDVLTGYNEMARICSVPISFLIFRGQGIKLTSFVAKKCREKDTLMPDLEKPDNPDKYEGAIVLPPKCAMYVDNPVACVDYSSLYPSAMISQNYSHDSKVWTKSYDLAGNLIDITGERDVKGNFIYDNLPGYHYINIEFETFKDIRKTKTSSAEKTKVGKMICRWAQFPNNKRGIMPSILEELLKARKDTRNMIKTVKDPFIQNILDKRQNGYKVTANSLYGQCGSPTSTFYERDIAASTTATGRMMIIYAKRIIEEVYGDMVYETAAHGPVRTKAEYIYGDSVASYTPVYVKVNGQLDICTIENLAKKYGGGLWTRCLEEGKQEKDVCELNGVETWSDKGWTRLFRVIRHALAPHKKMMRIITHQGLVDVTDDHSLVRSNGQEISPKDVAIGTELLHHRIPTETYADYIKNNNNEEYDISGITDHLLLANYCAKKQSLGFNVKLSKVSAIMVARSNRFRSASSGNVSIKLSKEAYSNSDCEIQSIEPLLSREGYVYDLTTENHHFAAGIGNMIVHNTDSVFFTFNLENNVTGEKIRGKTALEMTIEIAQDAAELCSKWLKSPMELAYEKTLMPFILLSKKRYVGMLYETNPNKGKLKFMGLPLKRRDSCDYLKDVYGEILTILMDPNGENKIKNAIEYLDRSLYHLIEGNVSMDKLAITKALRSDYKKPNSIGHKVLADRIGKRDPGNKPKPGDRMKFVFIVNENSKALMGDKIETPEFIIANKLQIDYTHYITNQLMKPLQQLFGLALEQIWELQNKRSAIKTYRADMKQLEIDSGLGDLETFMKNKEKYCAVKVKTLLFDKILDKIHNDKHKIQPITSFFGRK